MATEIALNIAWVALMSLLGLALPLAVGAMARRPFDRPQDDPAGPGGQWVRSRLLLAGVSAVLLSLACGFSLQYGAVSLPQLGEQQRWSWQWAPFGEGSGLLAWAGPGLPAGAGEGWHALFLFQTVGAVTVVVLALSPLRGRLPGPGLAAVVLLVAGGMYPLLGHWAWGDGWLAATGWTAYLGHGFVDWGGAGVHYAFGGLLGLAGLLATRGWRREPVEPDGPAAGVALLAILGMTALHLAAARGTAPSTALVVVNTWVSAAAAGLVAVVYMAFTTTRFRPTMLTRGILSGAAASAGLASFAAPTTLLLVGAGAGLLVCLGSYLVERVWRLDDPSGVVATFGLGGFWGALAVGLFASGVSGQGLNGVGAEHYLGVAGQGVSGIALLAPGMTPDFGQLAAQGLGLLVIIVWALGPGWLFFRMASIRPQE